MQYLRLVSDGDEADKGVSWDFGLTRQGRTLSEPTWLVATRRASFVSATLFSTPTTTNHNVDPSISRSIPPSFPARRPHNDRRPFQR
jgi:hypothetical protein